MRIAEDFVVQRRPHLLFTNEQWLDHQVNAYRRVEDREVRSAIQTFMDSAVDAKSGDPLRPDKYKVDQVVDALKSLPKVFRSQDEAAPPAWLDRWAGVDPDPKMCIAAGNGILDLATGNLQPNTPRFFTRNGLTFDYDEHAGPPEEWPKFLDSLWPLPELLPVLRTPS